MRRIVMVGALCLLLLGGCSIWGLEGGPGGAGAAKPTAAPTESAVAAVAGADGVQRIDITVGDDLRFMPSLVRAKPGVVEFTFHNTGLTPHDVRLSAATDSGNINGGDTKAVRITVDQPGRYPFPCVYHRSSGMIGTLIIE